MCMYIHACMHTHTHRHTRICTHTHSAYMCTQIHVLIHLLHTYIHMYTYTHAYMQNATDVWVHCQGNAPQRESRGSEPVSSFRRTSWPPASPHAPKRRSRRRRTESRASPGLHFDTGYSCISGSSELRGLVLRSCGAVDLRAPDRAS